MSIDTTITEQEELIEKSRKAILHVLEQIRTNPEVRYHLGFATQSFTLLTEAAAGFLGEPVEKVQAHYLNRR